MAASVYREVHRLTTVSASYQGAFERLEPVRLEIFQVRFLGGGGPVTARCYPACDTKLSKYLLQPRDRDVTPYFATGILPERASSGKPSFGVLVGCEAFGTMYPHLL